MASTLRFKVAQLDDLKDGTMKEVEFPPGSDTKILLSKIAGSVYATSNKCTHYGAPLVKGVLTCKGRVVCPWHGAAFDVCTGDIEDAPGLNNLQSFKVDLEGSSVFVTGPANGDSIAKTRAPPTVEINARSTKKGVVIIGGGGGGAHAVEGLREAGYKGSITVFSKENYLPVDRTKISKGLFSDPSKIALRDAAFYEGLSAKFKLDTEVEEIDFEADEIKLADGSKFPYTHLIVATGSNPNRLPLDGAKLGNIFVVRTVSDAKDIDTALGSDKDVKKNLVVIGSSFIGMEAALAASARAHVSIIGMEDAPFQAILGTEIGNGIRKFHESKGTKFYLPAALSHFTASSSDPTQVGAVVLKDGTSIPADIVVLGVGVKPATAVLKASGLELEKDHSVIVDEHLKIKEIAKGNVFAIGDIAKFPDYATGELTRVEHWNVASNHGRSVAKTIAGTPDRYCKIAVFWSAQGQQLRYAGTGKSKEWKDVIIKGDPSELKFVAYYTKDDEVVAVASMQNDPIVAHVSELFAIGKMITAAEVKAGKSPFDVPLE